MSIKAVLFDLDGTLLPLEQDEFVKAYFGLLSKNLYKLGFDPERLIKTVWTGTKAMMANDGKVSNEKVFWQVFCNEYGTDATKYEPDFARFYETDFNNVKAVCGFNESAAKAVKKIKDLGINLVLATSPVFPLIATKSRAKWAGIDINDFSLVTTYENSCHCKPNIEYYKDILSTLNLNAEECLMVGNDVDEDMIAEKLGINVFLLNEHIVNRQNADITRYPQGNFEQLINFIEQSL